MKKFMISVFCILAISLSAGCSGGIGEVKPVDKIPNPEELFPNSTVTIAETDPDAFYMVTEFEESEHEAYLKACEEAGFTDIAWKGENQNGDKMFFAYTEDGKFYLNVTYVASMDRLDIICNAVEEDK